MKFPTPRLEIYPQRIKENARQIVNLCHDHQIQVAAVTKVVAAHPAVVGVLEESGVDFLADSRLENLQRIKQMGSRLPLMLLRIPAMTQAARVVQLADISLNSSVETIQQLSKAATTQNCLHKTILMVDLGDLREGIWPDRVIDVLKQIKDLPSIEVIGLGSNLMCYGGIIPTAQKMQTLIDLREYCRQATGLPLEILNGGNSANLPLLASGHMPPEINQLRIGETIMLGCSVIDRSPWPETRQDTFRVVAEVVELQRKPSLPIGEQGQDAFGSVPSFVDRGNHLRAICNIGRQDVVIDNLQPEDSGIIILGGSSDHLILDVEEASPGLRIGDEVAFFPGYAALLAATTSRYVHKKVVRE